MYILFTCVYIYTYIYIDTYAWNERVPIEPDMNHHPPVETASFLSVIPQFIIPSSN